MVSPSHNESIRIAAGHNDNKQQRLLSTGDKHNPAVGGLKMPDEFHRSRNDQQLKEAIYCCGMEALWR